MKKFFSSTEKLNKTIVDRIKKMPKDSYTVELIKSGNSRIAQKVGEEGLEVALASMKKKKSAIIYETADLWYHLLVLLNYKKISLDEISEELEKRYSK